MHGRLRLIIALIALALLWTPMAGAAAELRTLLILHTNDLHDHLRPGYDGLGGMPYVAGYVRQVRAERNDVLLLDAGDVMEKGDMVAFLTQSRLMYEAMSRIGYDATTVGNHDLAYGVDHLRKCAALAADMALLCLNYLRPDGTRHFDASRVFMVNDVRVGVIGMTIPKGGELMTPETAGDALQEEAVHLKEDAHLVVALCHFSTRECAAMSARAPAVDVFIAGHSHEITRDPIRLENTGALVTQAGYYARYVGRLELVVDLDARRIADAKGQIVDMRHDAVPCDEALLAWVREQEAAIAPDASRIVARADRSLNGKAAAILAAAALRRQTGADIAFCHPGQIIRSGLPAGELDVNAFFRTGGQRGKKIVAVTLTGRQIEAYLGGLVTWRYGNTEWSGFHATLRRGPDGNGWSAQTDLESDRAYRVVMPELEWRTRYHKVFERIVRAGGATAADLPKPSPLDITFTEAVTAYLEEVLDGDAPLDAHVRALAQGIGEEDEIAETTSNADSRSNIEIEYAAIGE